MDDSTGTDDIEVAAAGGVVTRHADGSLQVLIVHRPHRHDWSFPKGKLDPGESFEAAARREVAEETGVEVTLVRELSPVTYRDRRGRSKLVRYWLMQPLSVNEHWHPPAGEIDEVRWVSASEAHAALTYAHDRSLVTQAVAEDG